MSKAKEEENTTIDLIVLVISRDIVLLVEGATIVENSAITQEAVQDQKEVEAGVVAIEGIQEDIGEVLIIPAVEEDLVQAALAIVPAVMIQEEDTGESIVQAKAVIVEAEVEAGAKGEIEAAVKAGILQKTVGKITKEAAVNLSKRTKTKKVRTINQKIRKSKYDIYNKMLY